MGLLWGKNLKTRQDLFRHLDKLHKWITSRGKVLKVIKSDNEFVTAVVTDWIHNKQGIRILPSIPYEPDTVCIVERASQTMDNTITKMLDLPRNKRLSRQHWAMAFTHALKTKNRLPSAAFQSRSPISLWQSEVLDSRRFPLQSYGTLVAAHIPLDTQNNGTGRSILGHYVGF